MFQGFEFSEPNSNNSGVPIPKLGIMLGGGVGYYGALHINIFSELENYGQPRFGKETKGVSVSVLYAISY